VHFSFSTFFQCFSSYSRSYSVCVSFSTFFNFLAILQVLPCTFLIFLIFPCFLPYSTSYNVCFSFFTIFSFLAILQVLQCAFLIFHIFECFYPYCRSNTVSHFLRFSLFSPYSTSYNVHFSFSTCLSVSHHILGHTVFVSRFSVFHHYPGHTVGLLIFHVFQFSLPYFTCYSMCFTFSMIFRFLT
jgi:hypothetical protein